MSLGFARRVDRLEDDLVIGEERMEYERLVRMYYNMQSVSDEALSVCVEALQKRAPVPDWAEEEFQRSVPVDAPSRALREAERQAREELALK